MRIAVAGAAGRVGRHVAAVLGAEGHEVVRMSRRTGVDVVKGTGLAQALRGVEVVVDAASGPSPEEEPATAFFTAAARNLQEAGARAGVRRLVVVSIIGIDRFAGGYMAAKRAHERAARAGPVPALVLRAAQFHEFVAQLVEWGRHGNVSYLPRMRTQLVAARTVGEVLARLSTGAAPGPLAAAAPYLELGGPRAEDLVDAARRLVARRGEPLRVEAAPSAGDPERELYEAGALLPGPGALLAGPSFDAWLEEGAAASPVARSA